MLNFNSDSRNAVAIHVVVGVDLYRQRFRKYLSSAQKERLERGPQIVIQNSVSQEEAAKSRIVLKVAQVLTHLSQLPPEV
jgi:hypothetical protein